MELLGLTTAEAAVVFAAALAGGMLRGFTGFGSALVISPILSIAVGPLVAVPATVLVLFISTFQLMPGAMRDVAWPLVFQMGVAGCIGVPLGVYALIATEPDLMRRGIAAVVVLFALAMLTGWRYQHAPSPWLAMAMGGIGGTLSGAGSVGGPPVIVFLLAGPDRAAANRAAIIFYFFFTQIVAVALYWFEGVIVEKVLWLTVLMLPAQMIGVWIGTRLFPKANETLYRRVALGFLLIIGLVTLVL